MTKVDAGAYYTVGALLLMVSSLLEAELRDLDKTLDTARSAGLYPYGGPSWAKSFDQSASDVFEAGSTAAMAAKALGIQIYTAGQNVARAENDSHPGTQQDIPDVPGGTALAMNLHPTELAVGSTEGNPDHWDIIEDVVKAKNLRVWADCDEARIATTGKHFTDHGIKNQDLADGIYRSVLHTFPEESEREDPILADYVLDAGALCNAIEAYSNGAKYLGLACNQVAAAAKSAKDDCRTTLKLLRGIEITYEADKAVAKNPVAAKAIDFTWETTKTSNAQTISDRLGNIEDKIKAAVSSNTGIYAMVTTELAYLSSILGRTPRNTKYVGRPPSQNKAAGDEGELRAGIDPTLPRRQITIIDQNGSKSSSIPDRIDDFNEQVTEVKNVNVLGEDAYGPDRSVNQIKTQVQWAQENGYTHTLIVDHRTQITDPDIQRLINEGKIELIRMELDDGPKT
ncbi:putative toxin [Nocardia sp. NPDC051832]|uniref:putative toxin n=1 Tax=Nocardia sp. NPDC051832 TaxID=3155673 RepID=UPI0034399179